MKNRWYATLSVLMATSLAAGACGTRVSERAEATARSAPNAATSIPDSAGDLASASPVAPVVESHSTTATREASPLAPAITGTGKTPTTVGSPTLAAARAAAAGAQPSPASSTNNVAEARRGPNPQETPANPVSGPPAGDQPDGKKSPLVIASVGTLSGPVGTVLLPFSYGLQLWVKNINAKGGVNGHTVALLIFDDGGDPARHQAKVQEAVEKNHVVAFVNQLGAVSTTAATVQYIESKGIPVVGTDGTGKWVYTSPMFFPLSASDRYIAFNVMGMAANVALPQGKEKLGVMVCAEADVCKGTDEVAQKTAQPLGFELQYRTRASLTQPDYTAECLAARNAGVDVLFIMLDQNSLGRVGNSCSRQGYKPLIVTFGHIFGPQQVNDPNLDGMYGALYGFPWFQSGTPATDEFQQALRTYGGKLAPEAGLTIGWRAGKAFEKAAAHVSEPPTPASILEGLWSFRNDDLGGLTYPLTFEQGKPKAARSCWYTILLQAKAFKSPDQYKLNCAEPPVNLY